MIFKPVGLELKMNDFNIPGVVPKLRVQPQHGTVVNTNYFALTWILVAFKGSLSTECVCVLGCWATESKGQMFKGAAITFFFYVDKQKRVEHTLSITE